MKKQQIIIGAIVVIVFLAASQALKENNKVTPSGYPSSNTQEARVVTHTNIDYSNIEEFLSSTSLVNDIPKDTNILLRFYNFDNGYREWEKSFVLTREKVEGGFIENPDLVVYIHSKYLDELNSGNLCSTFRKANNNGDFGYASELSEIKLLWKFKSMNKHKFCLGFD